MNLAIEIKKIQKDLELLQDKHLINSIKSLLSFAKKQSLTASARPFSIDEYIKRAEQSEDDIKNNRFIDVDDL